MALPCIKRARDGMVLARAEISEHVIALEGNWYFHPDSVNTDVLRTSQRQYVCPYKGTCWWVDLETDKHFLPDVAWIYPEPYPGFRRIAGWYGFYPSKSGFEKTEC
jgi:uncharacterized protein (DUF427 family)